MLTRKSLCELMQTEPSLIAIKDNKKSFSPPEKDRKISYIQTSTENQNIVGLHRRPNS